MFKKSLCFVLTLVIIAGLFILAPAAELTAYAAQQTATAGEPGGLEGPDYPGQNPAAYSPDVSDYPGQNPVAYSPDAPDYPGLNPADYSPEYQQYLKDLANGDTAKYGGLIPNPYPPLTMPSASSSLASASASTPASASALAALPQSYDPRALFLTPVKSQGSIAICEAFADMAAFEALVGLKTGRQISFSEEHLRFIQSNQNPSTPSLFRKPDDGFSFKMVTDYLTNWNKGIVTASAVPYYPYLGGSWPTQYMAAAQRVIHATETQYIPISDMKSAVMLYGGMIMSIQNPNYRIGEGGTYYNGDYRGADHAVCVVGWDDNFPASKYPANNRPPGDGAWLVKNSWGNWSGDGGYLWVSYHDMTFTLYSSYPAITDFRPASGNVKMLAENLDFNYGSPRYSASSASPLYFTDIYDLTSEFYTYGTITDVMFNNVNPGSRYDIYITPANPDGTPPAVSTLQNSLAGGTLPYEGYFTATLNNPYTIPSVGKYAVIVKITPPAAADVYIEMYYNMKHTGGSYYNNNGVWNSCALLDIRPVLYKRYPVINNATISPTSGTYSSTGTTLSTNINSNGNLLVSIQKSNGVILRQGLPEDYKYNANNFDYTLSEDSRTVTFTQGFLDSLAMPSTTLIEFIFNEGNKCTYTLNMGVGTNIPVTGVTLNKSVTTLAPGGTETLTATISPANASNKAVTWTSNNTAVATVDANGKITALAAGAATITVTTADGAKTAACTVLVEAPGVTPGNRIAAGYNHNVVIKSNGTVWAWGSNGSGQLGNGATTDSQLPVQVSNLSGVVSVSADYHYTMALKSDGSLWTWGYNTQGQLGNGTYTNSPLPVQVSGLSNVKSAVAGYTYALAIKSDGSVWAWGSGYLGNGASTSSPVPVQVNGLSDVQSVSVGQYYSMALKSDGTVWTWGDNTYGKLGNGTTVSSLVPVRVSGLSNVVSIIAGSHHAVAVKSDGTVWAWGYNQHGQLGNGTTIDSSLPVQVSGLSGVKSVAAGYLHTIALKSDGTVWAWGFNGYCLLGNGTYTSSSVPVQVSNLSGVESIAAAYYASLAMKSDGAVWAWGLNYYNQLGAGAPMYCATPVQVQGL